MGSEYILRSSARRLRLGASRAHQPMSHDPTVVRPEIPTVFLLFSDNTRARFPYDCWSAGCRRTAGRSKFVMQTLRFTTLLPFLLALGLLAPAPVHAGSAAIASVQDPPVIPRSLLKRLGKQPQRFVRTELFFGTATPGEAVTEERFLLFLDAEVTPRFPDGLTLFKGHGQFTGENGVLVKEEPFVLILLHPFENLRENNRKIEEIRRLYKKQFQQESVLRVDYQFSVRVSF